MSDQGVPGYEALFADINKVHPGKLEQSEGIASASLPELELDMDDKELVQLTKDWKRGWEQYQSEMKKKWDWNESYWQGKNKIPKDTERITGADKPNPDNLIFEALETYLPLVTRENPEPLVTADNTEDGERLASKVQSMLAYLANHLDLKLTLISVARNHELYFLGCTKVGWSVINNEVSLQAIRPPKLILDKDATIVNGEYTGDFLGEIRKNKAADLVRIFPKKKTLISELVQGKMATELNYTEWWTDDYVFWTCKDVVLDKKKNPHWNYDAPGMATDQFGQQTPTIIKGKNYFPIPKKPYVFFSVFNLGLHPFDETTLIHQNLRLQDMVSKRLKQIDQNADNTNGGSVVSGDYFTKEQAAKVGEAKRRGETVWIPTGDISRAYHQDVGPPLPPFVYESLRDYRQELKSNFGIVGSNAGSSQKEKSVRGKMLNKQHDVDRISGVIEYLEQHVEQIFGWWVQLFHVYYDEPHVASVIGADRAQNYFQLQNTDFGPKLLITMKEGSMIPKDPMAKMNQAIELFAQGGLDPVSLFEALEFPNPKESAKRLFIWKTNPAALFPELVQPGMPGAPAVPGAPPQDMTAQDGAGRPPLPGGMPATDSSPMTLPQMPTI